MNPSTEKLSFPGGLRYPRYHCLHQFFENQVKDTPQRLALVFKDQSLSYFKLNQKANRIAHCLREQGLDRNQIVAILADRSLEMVIGILAVLKAGGPICPWILIIPKTVSILC